MVRNLPKGMGVVLVTNHADETDFKVCIELSRILNRHFLYMMNREAFSEGFGTAGFWLQRLGAFSVERGGDTAQAKQYAVDVVKGGKDVLVVFPEGEIYYLNDIVQPFKTGAAGIALEAIIEKRKTKAEWSASLVPMAIKYHYRGSIAGELEARVRRLENRLSKAIATQGMKERLGLIVAELLKRKELANNLKAGSARLNELDARVQEVQLGILEQMEKKYPDVVAAPKAETLARSWRLSAHLRDLLDKASLEKTHKIEKLRSELAEMKHVAEMVSWQPQYLDIDPSEERMAEMVLKLEREIYGIKRPHQLGMRDVYVRLGAPIDLAAFVADFEKDARGTRRVVTEKLKTTIQSLLDDIEAQVRRS